MGILTLQLKGMLEELIEQIDDLQDDTSQVLAEVRTQLTLMDMEREE